MSLLKAPVAAKHPRLIEQLGRRRTDDYAWMKDDNWQQVLRDPKTLRADVREHRARAHRHRLPRSDCRHN